MEQQDKQNQCCGFVAVHVGAGYHSELKAEEYKETCRNACLQAIKLLKEKRNVLDATVSAVSLLEDAECTNAGVGSNLSVDGCVECDASIMDGKTMQFGAVGALSGIKNPIHVANALVSNQNTGYMSLGRVPPCVLVGKGAYEWSVAHGIPSYPTSKMITESTLRSFKKHRRKLDELDCETAHKCHKIRKPENLCSLNGDSKLNDTVGVVCLDEWGNIASAVSSGGIILKTTGRLGQAAMYGCGCWAQNGDKKIPSVAVSTSGCGEHLIKTLLAKECAEALSSETNPSLAISQTLTDKFIDAKSLSGVSEKLGGILALTGQISDDGIDGELLWAHTTETMCLGFMSGIDKKPKSFISHLSEGSKSGRVFNLEGTTFRWGNSQEKSVNICSK